MTANIKAKASKLKSAAIKARGKPSALARAVKKSRPVAKAKGGVKKARPAANVKFKKSARTPKAAPAKSPARAAKKAAPAKPKAIARRVLKKAVKVSLKKTAKPSANKRKPAATPKGSAPKKRTAKTPLITVLCGGCSSEREVSLVSGQKIFEALAAQFEAVLRVLDAHVLPEDLDPAQTVIFPAFHGTWGEDGGVQTLLESRGFAYAGCGPLSSARCMDKIQTKAAARACALPVVDEIFFEASAKPAAQDVVARLGDAVVVKPVDEGSSVGLHMVQGAAELEKIFGQIANGRWMIEPRIVGREFAVGVLDGAAMGIVEIVPTGGVYDYAHKYTPGSTRYEFPAKLDDQTARRMRAAAQTAFAACECRDFSRVDFMMDGRGQFYLLEINTIPGLTATSLLPKSASCSGLDFPALAKRMVEPAIARWRKRR